MFTKLFGGDHTLAISYKYPIAERHTNHLTISVVSKSIAYFTFKFQLAALYTRITRETRHTFVNWEH